MTEADLIVADRYVREAEDHIELQIAILAEVLRRCPVALCKGELFELLGIALCEYQRSLEGVHAAVQARAAAALSR
jgi:hypothetical protein